MSHRDGGIERKAVSSKWTGGRKRWNRTKLELSQATLGDPLGFATSPNSGTNWDQVFKCEHMNPFQIHSAGSSLPPAGPLFR